MNTQETNDKPAIHQETNDKQAIRHQPGMGVQTGVRAGQGEIINLSDLFPDWNSIPMNQDWGYK